MGTTGMTLRKCGPNCTCGRHAGRRVRRRPYPKASPETRAKMSQSQQRRWEHMEPDALTARSNAHKAWWQGLTEEERSVIRAKRAAGIKAVQHEPTTIELRVQELLTQAGYEFDTQVWIDGKFRVDIMLRDRTVIEVNGCFWHSCLTCHPKSQSASYKQHHDEHRRMILEQRGHKVIVIWDHELDDLDIAEAIDRG